MDKSILSLLLVLLVLELGCLIRQENINVELRQINALQKVQIEELTKCQRLTAQDVHFIEKLVIEGKQ
jgi:hypothetical protein